MSRGEGVVVAVVDTGVDYLHPDLAANIWINPGEDLDGNGIVEASDWNGVDDDNNGFIDDLRGFDFADSSDANQDGDYSDSEDESDPDPMDENGHGTHVSGIIAAVADNGIGMAGVAPSARIMALKGFPAKGDGKDSDLWPAVLYAAQNGAQVINNSWSCNPDCPENPLAEEIVEIVHALDVVIVTSAGNRSSDVISNSPEKLRETIVVASSAEDDGPSSTFSNHGWLIDVAAPGGGPPTGQAIRVSRANVLSLRASADETHDDLVVDDIYVRKSGTSMSAPHVAGVVALMRSADPGLDYESIRRRLRQSAVDFGPPGHDRAMGGGRLDAVAALTHELPDLEATIDSPRAGSAFSRAATTPIEIRGSAGGEDLASLSVYYGAGNDPAEWIPIVSDQTDPVQDDVLAVLPVDDLDPGTYVVKLEVAGREGSLYQEFLQLSLEDGDFLALSDRGRHSTQPDVSGDRVLWRSEPDPQLDPTDDDGVDLFVTNLRNGTRHLVAGGPGRQTSGSIDGRLVSWLDQTLGELGEPGPSRLFGCRLKRRPGRDGRICNPIPLAPGENVAQRPATAAGRFYWLDRSSGELDLRSCRLRRGRACQPVEPGLGPMRRVNLRTDGGSLAWSEAGFRFAFCNIDPRTGGCESQRFASPAVSLSRPTVSRDLVAWVEFAFSGDTPLLICEFDAASGDCPPVRVADRVVDVFPELSGDRLVWEARVGDEATDVFFCEYDRVLKRCPAQRLTAHMATDGAPVIDGTRVAWQSTRFGAFGVLTTLLPSLESLRDEKVRANRWLVTWVRGNEGDSPVPLRLTAALDGGTDLASKRAYFFDGGRGRGLLFWRPSENQVGSHVVTFSGRTSHGLTTRRSIRVEVLPGR
jgi:subtilisin family serine protease